MRPFLFLLLALGACAPELSETAVDADSWSAPSDQLAPPAFPIDLTGTLEYDFFGGMPMVADLVINADGTVVGVAGANGVQSPVTGTWLSTPRGIVIDLLDLGVVRGRPVGGCITGWANQATPAGFAALGLPARAYFRWDLCVVP